MTKLPDSLLIEEFDYPLPDDRIAKYPLEERDSSKLLVYKNENITQSRFKNIDNYISNGALLVYNNTRVIKARLHFQKPTGAVIEIFCLEPHLPHDYSMSLSSVGECSWTCMVGNLKKWKDGCLTKTIRIRNEEVTLTACLIASNDNTHIIGFKWNNTQIHFAELLENVGELPIPPYLHRDTEERDLTSYQTVYSRIQGSVAAPTAGLHFTPAVFESLKQKNINTCELTLHVGAGTFQPVKTRSVSEHKMHCEIIEVRKDAIKNIANNLGKIIAVGTTSVRTLESLYWIGCKVGQNAEIDLERLAVSQWEPYDSNLHLSAKDALHQLINYMEKNSLEQLHTSTQILIQPGYRFKIVDAIITNFHQPKSTLLLLIAAFIGEQWKSIYDYALENDFRFLSYGDSSILFRSDKTALSI
jgi:S-adenosylmethionine:tRNA ribosyltransferase-isomerase